MLYAPGSVGVNCQYVENLSPFDKSLLLTITAMSPFDGFSNLPKDEPAFEKEENTAGTKFITAHARSTKMIIIPTINRIFDNKLRTPVELLISLNYITFISYVNILGKISYIR
jgi:hypothetical protein